MKLIPILLRYPIPIYRENLNKVFSEEYIAEDEDLKPIIDLVLAQNWKDSKEFKPNYYRIRRDLFITPTNCLAYDNRLVIPNKIKHMVLESIHHKNPGQFSLLALSQLIWGPHIYSQIFAKAPACRHCTAKVKNHKALLPKTQLGSLPKLVEPNQQNQMDFACPNPFKKNTQNIWGWANHPVQSSSAKDHPRTHQLRRKQTPMTQKKCHSPNPSHVRSHFQNYISPWETIQQKLFIKRKK